MAAPSRFADRRAAGRVLAEHLRALHLPDPVVLALPRGGVPVAAEVAAALGAPLDVLVARKIGRPGHPELGVGGLAEGGEPVLDAPALARAGLTPEELTGTIEQERRELDRRVARYRGGRPLPALAGRSVLLVDDGVARGVTARAALRVLRAAGPARLVLAVPVGPRGVEEQLADEADQVVCVLQPEDLRAVGAWYERFDQTSDAEVLDLLARSAGARGQPSPPGEH